MLRPDGTVFATGSGQGASGGGTGNTAIYTIKTGTWAAGPTFPNGDNAGDSFSVLEPDGDVLVFGVSGELYDFNGTTMTAVGYEGGTPILLPTGQIAMFGSNVDLYTPSGQSNSAWAPTIRTRTQVDQGRYHLQDLGYAVQRYVAADGLRRRISKCGKISVSPDHEYEERQRGVRPDA